MIDGVKQAVSKFNKEKLKNANNSMNKLGIPGDSIKQNYNFLNYDLFSDWNPNYNPYKDEINKSDMSQFERDKKIKEIIDVVQFINKWINLAEDASKNGKQQQIEETKNQLDQDFKEINYETDKDTIIKNGKQVINLLKN